MHGREKHGERQSCIARCVPPAAFLRAVCAMLRCSFERTPRCHAAIVQPPHTSVARRGRVPLCSEEEPRKNGTASKVRSIGSAAVALGAARGAHCGVRAQALLCAAVLFFLIFEHDASARWLADLFRPDLIASCAASLELTSLGLISTSSVAPCRPLNSAASHHSALDQPPPPICPHVARRCG